MMRKVDLLVIFLVFILRISCIIQFERKSMVRQGTLLSVLLTERSVFYVAKNSCVLITFAYTPFKLAKIVL